MKISIINSFHYYVMIFSKTQIHSELLKEISGNLQGESVISHKFREIYQFCREALIERLKFIQFLRWLIFEYAHYEFE